MFPGKADPTRKESLLVLIAWLSVCLLGAGPGRQFDPAIRAYWVHFGAFGLVAAVGLHAAGRAGRAVERNAQRTRAQLAGGGDLAHPATPEASFSKLGEGARRNGKDRDFDI
jgi:hypothetical protein